MPRSYETRKWEAGIDRDRVDRETLSLETPNKRQLCVDEIWVVSKSISFLRLVAGFHVFRPLAWLWHEAHPPQPKHPPQPSDRLGGLLPPGHPPQPGHPEHPS